MLDNLNTSLIDNIVLLSYSIFMVSSLITIIILSRVFTTKQEQKEHNQPFKPQ